MNELEEMSLINRLIDQIGTFRIVPIMTKASKTAQELKLTEEQLLVLIKLKIEPDLLVTQIAEKLEFSASKSSRIIKSLVSVGFVKRVYHEIENENIDRRTIKLEITPEGKEFLEKYFQDVFSMVKKIIQKLGQKKVEELTSLLEEFNSLVIQEYEMDKAHYKKSRNYKL